MARFAFRLQRALDYRQHKEDAATLQLSRAEAALADEVRRRVGLRLALSVQLDELRRLQVEDARKGIPAWGLSTAADRISAARERIALQDRIVVEARGEAAQRREAVVAARREKRTLELLRERDRVRWQREEDRRERIELDEIFSTRAGRSRAAG